MLSLYIGGKEEDDDGDSMYAKDVVDDEFEADMDMLYERMETMDVTDILCVKLKIEEYRKVWKPCRKALIVKVIWRMVTYWIRKSVICGNFSGTMRWWIWRTGTILSGSILGKTTNMSPMMAHGWLYVITLCSLNGGQIFDHPSTRSTLHWCGFDCHKFLEFFNRDLLLRLGNIVGKAVRVYFATMMSTRGEFARVYTKVDLWNRWCYSLQW